MNQSPLLPHINVLQLILAGWWRCWRVSACWAWLRRCTWWRQHCCVAMTPATPADRPAASAANRNGIRLHRPTPSLSQTVIWTWASDRRTKRRSFRLRGIIEFYKLWWFWFDFVSNCDGFVKSHTHWVISSTEFKLGKRDIFLPYIYTRIFNWD